MNVVEELAGLALNDEPRFSHLPGDINKEMEDDLKYAMQEDVIYDKADQDSNADLDFDEIFSDDFNQVPRDPSILRDTSQSRAKVERQASEGKLRLKIKELEIRQAVNPINEDEDEHSSFRQSTIKKINNNLDDF